MLYKISHTTSYKYQFGVTFCHNIATIKPKNMLGQTVVDYKLNISPEPTEFSEKLDFFGNTITRFSIQEHHKTLEVKASSRIQRDYTLEPDIQKSQSGKRINLIEALDLLKSKKSPLYLMTLNLIQT